jgi:hypothetical protein
MTFDGLSRAARVCLRTVYGLAVLTYPLNCANAPDQ